MFYRVHFTSHMETDQRSKAVVWKITPLFADWIASPSNILFKNALLSSSSTVLELGCGVSAIVGLALSPYVAKYIATEYVLVSTGYWTHIWS